ncbi:MAG: hypothetical protein JSU90_00170 [Nitrospiraceae bacterium]|nr:MAG: hypothetical protein JSU90_00170 [Nitrospiraceae bacterium]
MSNLEEWSMRVEDDGQEASSACDKKTGASCSRGGAGQRGAGGTSSE